MKIVQILTRGATFTVGLFLLANFFYTMPEVRSKIKFLQLIIAIIFISYAVFHRAILELSEKGILRYIRHLGYLGVFAMLLICTVIFAIGRVNTTQFDEDAVIVLGGGFLDGEISPSAIRRLDRAVQYYDRNSDAIFVLSGGKTQWQPIAEGYVMRDYLLERGIPEVQILVEDSAMNTSENIAKSKEILDEHFTDDYIVCIITSDYHGYRSIGLSEDSGIDGAKRYLARTPDRLIPPAYLRELCAVIKFWILR